MTEKAVMKIRKPPEFYPINFEKLKGESMETISYFLGILSFSEDYEYFDKIKHLLIIPEKPKTLEEISQEFDEKIDKLIEDVKYKFEALKYRQEYQFSKKITQIIEDIEHAKKYGSFPVVVKLDYSNLCVNNTASWDTEFRVGKDEVGYWDIHPNIRVYLERKPNLIVRYFTKLLLNFTWVDV